VEFQELVLIVVAIAVVLLIWLLLLKLILPLHLLQYFLSQRLSLSIPMLLPAPLLLKLQWNVDQVLMILIAFNYSGSIQLGPGSPAGVLRSLPFIIIGSFAGILSEPRPILLLATCSRARKIRRCCSCPLRRRQLGHNPHIGVAVVGLCRFVRVARSP